MAKNKIITSQGNVQFINSKGKTISMHPMHCYAVYQDDTVSFLFIYMKEYSGQAFFASQFEDLEVDGETYDSIDALKEAIAEAFAKAGAQARTEIVDELPETGYTNTIYLLPKEHGTGYDEYVYNEEKGWQLLGDTDIEFERYLEKSEFYDYSAATEVKINYISGAVDDNASDIQFLSGAVDTEISDREAADAVISGAVDTLSTNLSNEVQRAQNVETALGNRIDSANARIDAEQLARANADNALSGAIDSVDDKIEALSGEVQTMGDEAIVDAEYVSSSTTIDFYNASGAVVAQVDATDFIKDGMIEDVRIETINGVTYLVIDFNTASGKEDIKIPLTDIFNPDNYYDKTAVDGFVSDLEATDSVISGAVDNVSSDLATESQRAQNAEGVLSGAIDTKLAISDFNTYSASVETELSSKANSADVYTKSEVYTKAEVDEAIAEIDLSEYYTSAQTDSKIAEAVSGKVDTSDFNTYSGAVETALGNKVETSDFEVYSGAVDTAIASKFDASGITAYSTSQEVTAEIEAATSGKVDTTAFTAYSASVETALGNKADLSALTEDERVWGEALNDLNSRINTVSGDVADKADVTAVTQVNNALTSHTANTNVHVTASEKATWNAKSDFSGDYNDLTNKLSAGTNITIVDNVISAQGGGGSSYTAGDGIDITNDVISVTGKADTSAVTAIQDSLSGYVTTDTEQIISGRKIFTYTSSSAKAIEFKQTDDSSKVGFRVRTSAATNNELASFEFRPNTFTIDNVQHPLMYFGQYRNTATANAGVPQTVIGFRQYDQKNFAAYHYLMPLPEKAKTPFRLTPTFKDYYAPMGFKNGSRMIIADNTGVVDLSSELDGLKLKKLTQAEYDALVTKDSNTLYIISD